MQTFANGQKLHSFSGKENCQDLIPNIFLDRIFRMRQDASGLTWEVCFRQIIILKNPDHPV